MIGYITLGTNNIEKASAFYDELFSIIGVKQVWSTRKMVYWGAEGESVMFAITVPFNKEEATSGNGVMIALKAPDQDKVNAIYQKAIELGAESEGEPGERSAGLYCAYIRDLDGNKLNFHCAAK
jgi:predicted lactoylglutathione lyase